MEVGTIIEITPVFVDIMPPFKEMKKNHLYISEMYETAIHKCLCGCGEKTVTPLRGGNMWKLQKDSEGKISLIGSIGNYQFPCKSHYIITANTARFV